MIKSFFEAGDSILTVNDNNQNVFGSTGMQTVKLKTGATNVRIDSNIEKVYLDNAVGLYKFQQAGNQLNVFDNAEVTPNLIAQIGMREEGTFLSFANGTAKAAIFADGTGVHISIGTIVVNSTTPTALTAIPTSELNTFETSTSSGTAFSISTNPEAVGSPTQEGKTITFTVTPNAVIDKSTQLNIDFVGQALNSIVKTTSADDFNPTSSIFFNAGDTTAKQITVTVKNDGNPEGIEAYKARLLDSLGNEKSSIVGTIVDGMPILNVSANNNSVNEGSNVVFNVTSDVAAPIGGMVIPYKLNGSTATATVDYTVFPTTGTVIIPVGEKTGSLTFSVNSDLLVEAPETIVVTLDPIANTILNTNTASTTINDTSVVLETNKFFFSGSASINEGEKAVYTISHAPVASTTTIPYTITGTVNSSDYSGAASGVVTFIAGDTSKTIELPITSDSTTEGNETLTITLGTPSLNTETIAIGQTSITTTILDTSTTGASNSFKLTTVTDTITGTDGNDLISAYIDASGTTDTLNTGDIINGGAGNDMLLIAIDGADAGILPTATITNVETVSIKETGGVAGSYSLASISGLTTVINNVSTDDVSFNVTSGMKLIIQGDGVSINANTTFDNATDLTFNGGVIGGNVTRNSTGLAAMTINSTGAENVVDTLDLDTAKTLTSLIINATSNLTTTLASDYASGASITIAGSATTVDLSGAALSAAITSINASGLINGGVVIQVNQADKTADTQFTGGSGNDTLDIGKVKYSTLTANGLLGVDTLKVSDQDTLSATTIGNITNFERLEIYDDNDGIADTFDVSLKGINAIQIDADSAGDGYVLNNLSADQATSLVIAGNQTVSPTFNVNNATLIGKIDALGVTIDAGVTGNAVKVAGINAPGIEEVNLNAVDSFTATTLTGLAALTTLTIVGSGDINLTTDKLQLNLNSTIDASRATGMIIVDASAATTATTTGISIKGSLSQANFLTGSDLPDVITGGRGVDSLTGGGGADTLNGGANADVLNGGAGADALNGGAGADVLNGGVGTDTLNGGSGDDLFTYATTADLFDKNALIDSIAGGFGTNSLSLGTAGSAFAVDVKDIWTGATGIDTLIGVVNSTANTLVLDKSAETAGVKLIDLSNNTALTGNIINVSSFTATNMTLFGSTIGASSISGGSGADTITGGAGSDTITGGLGSDVINITAGIDTITDFATGDTLNVSSGATAKISVAATGGVIDLSVSTIHNLGTLFVDGSAGTAAETITGSTSADSITGGAGSDVITGGVGIDSMTGGAGADKFIFAALTDVTDLDVSGITVTDEIVGFTTASDSISLGAAGILSVGVKQVSTITIAGSVEANESVTVTGVATGSVIATTGADAAATATALVTAINAAAGSTVTATSASGVVTLTAKVAGTAFTATTSVDNGTSTTVGASTTAVVATTTANTPEVVGANFAKVSVAATSLTSLLTAADIALDGTIDYYFGVVGSDGYLVTDADGSGHTDIIKLTAVTTIAAGDIVT